MAERMRVTSLTLPEYRKSRRPQREILAMLRRETLAAATGPRETTGSDARRNRPRSRGLVVAGPRLQVPDGTLIPCCRVCSIVCRLPLRPMPKTTAARQTALAAYP